MHRIDQMFFNMTRSSLVSAPSTGQIDATANRDLLTAGVASIAQPVGSHDLVVAFHLDRNSEIEIGPLSLAAGELGELWLFGATDQTQNRWRLIGNLLALSCQHFVCDHPTE